jgi:hypothetical protein
MPRFNHYRLGAKMYDKLGCYVVPLQRGGVTIATSFDEAGRVAGLGFAFCSAQDNYCRATGRDTAVKHMHPGRDTTELDEHRVDRWARRIVKYVWSEYGASPCLLDAAGNVLSMDDIGL